jgi:ATP/maltotriose-dependent transcriptional regulator MalT
MTRGAIYRPALVEMLTQSTVTNLSVICAPTGSGQVTLPTEGTETASELTPATAFAWVTL